MLDYVQARRNMVDGQLRTFDVHDRAVLAAMAELPRELFVAPGREDLAYLDATVPAAGGRPMLPPMVLGRMLQALDIAAGELALDVAGGAGYASAVLARLGAKVALLDPEADGPAIAARLGGLGLAAEVVAGPLEAGAPGQAPFDVILVNGAVDEQPTTLLDQLSPKDGRLVCLQHDAGACRAMLYVRSGEAIGLRQLFDAFGPALPAFRRKPGFVF